MGPCCHLVHGCRRQGLHTARRWRAGAGARLPRLVGDRAPRQRDGRPCCPVSRRSWQLAASVFRCTLAGHWRRAYRTGLLIGEFAAAVDPFRTGRGAQRARRRRAAGASGMQARALEDAPSQGRPADWRGWRRRVACGPAPHGRQSSGGSSGCAPSALPLLRLPLPPPLLGCCQSRDCIPVSVPARSDRRNAPKLALSSMALRSATPARVAAAKRCVGNTA